MKREKDALEYYSEDASRPQLAHRDEMGNPLRDARFYSFSSNTISKLNQEIKNIKYQKFDIDELDI